MKVYARKKKRYIWGDVAVGGGNSEREGLFRHVMYVGLMHVSM